MFPAIMSVGLLLGACWSAIGPIFPIPSNSPESLCESQLSPFPNTFLKWRMLSLIRLVFTSDGVEVVRALMLGEN